MKKIVFFFITLVTVLAAFSQNQHTIDSLKNDIVNFPKQDSFRVKAIFKYLKANINNNTSGDLPYILEMIRIARAVNYRYGISRGLQTAVTYYGDRGDFSASFLYADTVTALFGSDTSYNGKRTMGILYSNKANNYVKMADYENAIKDNILAVETFEKLKDTPIVIQLYLNISDVYSKFGDTLKCVEYTAKAGSLADSYGNEVSIIFSKLGHAANLGTVNRFKEADDLLESILPLLKKNDNSSFWQSYYYIKGSLLRRSNKYGTAVPFFQKSLYYATLNDDIHQKTGVMEELYTCYLKLHETVSAKKYLDTVLLLSQSSDLKMRKKSAYEGLADWSEQTGNFKDAVGYLKQAALLNDSILTEDNKKQIASLEMKYQVANKENEIKALQGEKEVQQLTIKQKSNFNYFLTAGLLALLIILFLSARGYKQKQKLQQQRISELETEKKLAATESVLKGEEQERTRLAKDLHDGLGGMLSGIKYSLNTMKGNLVMTPENAQAFERSMDMLDSSIKEMRRVAHNMMPEALVKFGLDTALKDFCSDINQSGALKVNYQSIGMDNEVIDQTTAITIYRIVQELINNTMKHAAAKNAIVQITKSGAHLSVTVEDDGKGFDTVILQRAKGIGWANIQSRVDFLKGTMDVQSAEGKGTSVHIELNA